MGSDSKIKKVLIANRGEIARRIRRACDALEIPSATTVSEADALLLPAREAGEVVNLRGSSARESYLDIEQIIKGAQRSGCNAVHPGYGFLSENAEFAERVTAAGLIFIGPSAESIRTLGSKPAARAAVQRVGVPTTPGSQGASSDTDLIRAANEIGYPVIIKAAAGGGGRGMRIVERPAEMTEALKRARAEALKNFSSDEVYIEKFIVEPRHVEVQLFGDHHGNVVHFGTRDCSAQRRHQKLVEEAPAPFLDSQTRAAIHDAAVRAAQSVGYYNAGTAEFLVKGSDFYFLEINTRIQVEHPVTEEITGVDLVQLQLKVAMGEALPFRQEEIKFNGHAIEFRINAEDTSADFRPAVGPIKSISSVPASYVREERGYAAGDTIPPYYDSLLSKVIVTGETRQEALARAFHFFRTYSVSGVPTSVPFHAWLLCNPDFQGDGIDIGYVERKFSPQEAERAAALCVIDPAHKNTGMSGAAPIELLSLSGTIIQIVHESGGTFLSIPLDQRGQSLPQYTWRRSNSREGAIEAMRGVV